MKSADIRRMVTGALAPMGVLFVATPAAADLVLYFENDRTDASTLPAYITFTGAASGGFDATNIRTGAPLEEGVSYSLQDLVDGVDVTKYKSGRVFVSLGSKLIDLSASNDYAPNFLNPNGPNFTTRMDKYEITYNGSTGGANLSSTDFFGLPLKLQTTGGSQPTTLTWNYNADVDTATVFHRLGALENYETDTKANTLGALVPNGDNGVTVNTPGGPLTGVVRIIAPSTTNGGVTPYPNFGNYLTYLQTGGSGSTPIHADIAGQNGQYPSGGSFQNYNLDAYISNSAQTINGMSIHPGDLVLNGKVTLGAASNDLTIVVTKANLTSYAIYGANPTYTICNACSDPNKVVQKVVADYFSGLNFGFIGSNVSNPNALGKTIGASPSWTWYGNKPNGGGPNPLPLSDAYAAAQPSAAYYNAYAGYLNNSSTPVTDSYGFPYTDRLTSPLAPLDSNTILTMFILPDMIASGMYPWEITVAPGQTQEYPDAIYGPTPSAALTVTGGGTAILSGQNTYSGGTTITDGTTVQVTNSNPGVSSSIGTGGLTLDNGIVQAGANGLTFTNAISVTSNGGTFDSNGNTLTWSGAVSGEGRLAKVGSGTLILTGANTYAGGTLLDFGTLGIGSNGALGSGVLTMQPGTTLQFEANDLTLTNAIVLNADPTIDTGSNTDTISGVISGSGALDKIGSGTLILSGANTYSGPTDVEAGTLGVTGALASIVTVESGATLGGAGTIGGLVANSGATIAPGALARYSTLTVNGAASFAAGSFFAVNIGPAGQNDRLMSSGTTTISGGTVELAAASGAYSPSTRYTLLTAQDGVSGTFSSLSNSMTSAFLDPTLSYDANDVYLNFAVKPFASVAQTQNQVATAVALQAQAPGSPLYDALIGMSAPDALQAFNALSGEIHASAVSAAFDDQRLPREAVFDRLATPYDGALASDAQNVQTLSAANPSQVFAAWGQAFDDWGHIGGNGNAASLTNDLGGLVFGADATLQGRYRVGVAGGYDHSTLGLGARNSSGSISTTFVGLYGGVSEGALQLRGGGFYGANHFATSHTANLPGIGGALSSGYGGDTWQAFAEAGWRMSVGGVATGSAWIEPFAGLTGLQIATDSFGESVGAAALNGASATYDYGITMLGLRGEASLFASAPLVANARIGWQHAFGDVTPTSILAFASAPYVPFAIAGAPIARNALALEAGVDWRFTANVKLGVYYSGLIASNAGDNAVKLKAEANF